MEDVKVIEISVTEAKERIKRNYLKGDRTTVLLLGKPGIGKSEVVRVLAKELAEELNKEFIEFKLEWTGNGLDYTLIYRNAIKILKEPNKYFVLITLRLSEREPADFIGYPRQIEVEYNGKKVTLSDYNPFIWQIVASGCAGILLLDDFTNIARPDVESVSYQLTLDRMMGWIKFNDKFIIIATGNKPEHSSIAKMLPTPQISRLRIYNVKEPSIDEWIKYMNEKYDKWDERIAAFLKVHSDYFIEIPKEPETLDPYPTPRTWSMLAKISYDMDSEDLFIEACATVGQKAASMLKAFIDIKVPKIEELIANPEIYIQLNFEQRTMLLINIAKWIRDNIDKINIIRKLDKVIEVIYDNNRDEVVFVLNILPKDIKIQYLKYILFESSIKDKMQEFTKELFTLSELRR